MAHTLLIAEVGINHNGDVGLAKEAISAARDAGADIVKFQTYLADEVMTSDTPLAAYMQCDEENFLALARRLQLTFDQTLELQAYACSLGVEFLSSPFDVQSCEFLGTIGLRRLKIPSGEAVNPFLLKAAAITGLPILLSTGMASLKEISRSLDYLKLNQSGPITLLHCTSQYPAEPQFCNLKAIESMSREFNLPVGYSDHTTGIEVSIAAVALGASVIEKHFTLDRRLPGPDQEASLEPQEFSAMTAAIRRIEVALGDGHKRPWPVELEVAKVARKSLVTRRPMAKGQVITMSDLSAKRPGTGIPAMEVQGLLGKVLLRDVQENTLLSWGDVGEP